MSTKRYRQRLARRARPKRMQTIIARDVLLDACHAAIRSAEEHGHSWLPQLRVEVARVEKFFGLPPEPVEK